MKPRIVVCTTESAAWDALSHAMAAGDALRLERVERLSDVPLLPGAGIEVAAVVIDDRFHSILFRVESSLRRYSPVFLDTVFMTTDQALIAHWIGLLQPSSFSPASLADWMNQIRNAPGSTAIWH
jgi:hypothetical protein